MLKELFSQVTPLTRAPLHACCTRQSDDEFREGTGFGVNADGSAMLLDDDVMSQQQA